MSGVRAAIYEQPGEESRLTVREIPTPEPGPGEVRVRLAVAGVNPTDWKARKRSTALAGSFQIPGQDGAGTIDAVGEGVARERVGERVWLLLAAASGRPWGTAAEYTVIPADRAVPLPDQASFELGASLGVPALTAAHCLALGGPVQGRDILVSGGAGAVGHAAIELARFERAGRIVTTVSSEEKARLAQAAGADTVVNYRDADAADQIRAAVPDGIDTFVEVALRANLPLDLQVAAPHAVIAAYAGDPDDVAQVPVRELMGPCITLAFMILYAVTPDQLRAAIERTSAALSAGALTTLPLHRFPLEQATEAHDAVEAGAVGKVVIDLPG